MAGFIARGGEAPHLDPNSVVIVGLDTAETPDNWFAHCSRLKDETDAELADYVADVRRIGRIDDPIDVYRDGDKVVVLDGRRSTRVARIVWAEQAAKGVPVDQRVTVRALIRRGPPEELFRYNVDSHKKKALTATQRARQFLNFHQATGEDVEKTATMFSCTEATVRNMLKVFDLAVEAQHALDEGFPLREAIKLADLPRAEQKSTLAELRAKGAIKGRRAANGIAAAKKGRKIDGDDTSRMRSRTFLEKWRDALVHTKAKAKVDVLDVVKFVLGCAPPADPVFEVSLAEAGFKPPKKSGRK